MAYNLNALFQICCNGTERQTVAALEIGKYNMFESACADRDEFTMTPPRLVSDLQQVLSRHYEIPVTFVMQITCPPTSSRGLSI